MATVSVRSATLESTLHKGRSRIRDLPRWARRRSRWTRCSTRGRQRRRGSSGEETGAEVMEAVSAPDG